MKSLDVLLADGGEPMFAVGVAARLAELRNRSGLTNAQLSTRADCASTTVNNVTSMSRMPNAREIVGLCRILKVTPNELLGWDRIAELDRVPVK